MWMIWVKMCQMLLSILMTMAGEYLQNAFVVLQITLHKLKLVLTANQSKLMLFTSSKRSHTELAVVTTKWDRDYSSWVFQLMTPFILNSKWSKKPGLKLSFHFLNKLLRSCNFFSTCVRLWWPFVRGRLCSVSPYGWLPYLTLLLTVHPWGSL